MTAAKQKCPTCSGKGSHSRALGVVSPDDFSYEEWQEYLNGGYDSQCDTCNGTGQIEPKQMIRHRAHLHMERYGNMETFDGYGEQE